MMKCSPRFKDYKLTPIHKGWSSDRKYLLETPAGEKGLLRVSDEKEYEQKQQEFNVLKKISAFPIPCSRPKEFGMCEETHQVWMHLSWIEGEDLEPRLNALSEAEQYRLGVEAGKILHQIQQVEIAPPTSTWEDQFNAKIDRKIKQYQGCGFSFSGDQKILDFISTHRHLIKGRPQTFQHGDYHVGNMLLTPSGELAIIDFNRLDVGDPWEEFNRITFCAEVSPHFATGRLHGYFKGEPPLEFFQLLTLYIATNALAAIPWAIPYGEEEISVMMKQAQQVLDAYDGMETVIPKWYLPLEVE